MDELDKAECKGCEESMKLQRHYAYKYKDKEYHKNVIVISDETIAELGWKAGQELQGRVRDNKLVIEPVSKKDKVNQHNP